ncbi:MAG: hypothetical protein ACKVT0_04075 [Planctomycetaceae bacterium]
MNTLAIQISAANEYGERMAILRIDGRELLDIVRDVEAPITAKAGEADLAGKYHYLSVRDVLHPSRQLLGEPIRPLLEYDGKVSILECECGCEGCWPLIMHVDVTETQVIWQDFHQVHRDNWEYPNDFRFVFDRSQIEAALKIMA